MACGMYGGQERYGDVMKRTDGNIPLGRPGRRWKNSIKMDLQKYRLGRH